MPYFWLHFLLKWLCILMIKNRNFFVGNDKQKNLLYSLNFREVTFVILLLWENSLILPIIWLLSITSFWNSLSPHIVILLPLILRILWSTSWFVFLLKRTTSYFFSLFWKVIYTESLWSISRGYILVPCTGAETSTLYQYVKTSGGSQYKWNLLEES